MSATVTEAVDEIIEVINDAWTSSVIPLGFEALQFEDNTQVREDDLDLSGNVKNWGTVFIRHDDGFTATLAGATGTTRNRRVGSVTVEIRTRSGDGRTLSDAAVQAVQDALIDGSPTASGVIFRRIRPLELGQTGVWYQVNVLASLEYDYVK